MQYKIALAGNPNCGKTTMFNSLTGSSQYVGNWPGVTVEKKEGRLKHNRDVFLIDLPGIYSLSPYTPEEVVARDYLLKEKPDVIINIVDATNLERNLYLTTQLLELGIPVVIALNMMDLAEKSGTKIDTGALEKELNCPVMKTSALKGTGIREVSNRAIEIAENRGSYGRYISFGEKTESALADIQAILDGKVSAENRRWFAVKAFERDEKIRGSIALSKKETESIENIISYTERELDDDGESIITNERYDYITSMISGVIKKKARGLTTSDRIDRVVTNRILAIPIFAAVMFVVYYISVTTIGTIVTDWTNDTLFGSVIQPGVGSWLESVSAAPWLTGLIVDGIIGGVGAVLGFVPQMMVLFLFLSLLEDCGYMARVAFIMDRIFKKFGLSGKSFIPMLISSGCGVPGVMATKTIENEKDRRMTIITTTFIPCGAKLPVIALIAGAIMGGAWWMAPMMYFTGVGAVVVSGIMLKKTRMFAGEPSPFVMELPAYHRPAAAGVVLHVWERCRAFIIKAGTVIFLACGIIWYLSNFGISDGAYGMVDVEGSFLAYIGTGIAWIFAPLGFADWKAAVATVTGLVAKENVVGTFGVLFGMADATEQSAGLWDSIGMIFPSTAAAMSFLIFNMLCAPCFAAIGAISNQMGSGKWTAFAIGYQTVFAYGVSMIVYQFGSFLGGGGFTMGTAAAIIVLAIGLFLLLRPGRKFERLEESRLMI